MIDPNRMFEVLTKAYSTLEDRFLQEEYAHDRRESRETTNLLARFIDARVNEDAFFIRTHGDLFYTDTHILRKFASTLVMKTTLKEKWQRRSAKYFCESH